MSKYAEKLQFKDNDNVSVEAVQKGERTAVKTANIIHRQKIKRGYATRFREAKKNGKSLKNKAVQTKKVTEKAVAAATKHPVVLGILGGLLLIIIVLFSIVPSCSNVAINAMSAVFSSSYFANDSDIDDAELTYTEWETDLRITIDNVETDYPDYDEYNYNIGAIGHNPYELMAYLTAKYKDFWFFWIESDIKDVFNEQYTLKLIETTEVRYNDDGEPYDWRVLTVNLTVKPLSEVIAGLLDDSQRDTYDILLVSKGSRQYVGSPFDFEWLTYISSGYGWRISPITGAKEFHKGVDIAVPEGTEIIAAHAGVVEFAGWDDSYGNYIIITGSGGIATKYAHCSSLLVTEGQTVEAGETIALVGSTGDSTGSHLHFETLKNNRNLNPFFFALTK